MQNRFKSEYYKWYGLLYIFYIYFIYIAILFYTKSFVFQIFNGQHTTMDILFKSLWALSTIIATVYSLSILTKPLMNTKFFWFYVIAGIGIVYYNNSTYHIGDNVQINYT